jgi:ABC-2 type transport system permease protein
VRLWEWIAASSLYVLIKVAAVGLILSVLANALYAFNVLAIGWAFVPLVASLLVFGWAIGFGTAGLLLRYGYAAEALIWGIPFLLQPFSCVFYPLDALPAWAGAVARLLPSTYAFEGLRLAMVGRPVPETLWLAVIGLNALYLVLGAWLLTAMLRAARRSGRLGHLGQD